MKKRIEKIEVYLVLTLLVIHGFWYNLIGKLASLRGVDFSHFIKVPLDNAIPFVPYFVLPYLFIWIYPILMLAFLLKVKNFDTGMFRRVYFSFLALMVICYLFWIIFPSYVHIRINHLALMGGDFWSRAVLFTYQNTTRWNSIPSFHICIAWFSYRTIRLYTRKFEWVFFSIFVLTVLAALLIRIHYIADILGGWVISEAVYRLVLVKMEKKKSLSSFSSASVILMYTILFFVFIAGYVLLQILSNTSFY